MSLQIAAQHLAKKGRGPDTELVHMTKGEIAGLQSLALAHGGSLTINPHTGLAEAGFLSSILPMIAGFALGPAGFGLMSSLGAAATVGGITGLASGSLGKGLMAGLGAYGGSSLAGDLMGAGGGLSETALNAAAQQASLSGMSPEAYKTLYAATSPSNIQALQAGAGQVFSSAPSAMNFAKQNMLGIGALAAPIAAGMTPNYTGAPASTQSSGNITPFGFTRNVDDSDPRNPRVNQYYTAGTPVNAPGPAGYPYQPGQVIGMADGGMAMGNENYPLANSQQVNYASFSQNPVQNNVLNNASDVKVDPSTGAEMFAQGGIASLGSYSDGGQLLKGPGDGVSDNIPAVIGKSQPARLADGEFVLPSRIVSEIGNGSTDAGARELYKMMARIQKSRSKTVGKDKVAVDSKARNLLPA